jgi:hypothetical protein
MGMNAGRQSSAEVAYPQRHARDSTAIRSPAGTLPSACPRDRDAAILSMLADEPRFADFDYGLAIEFGLMDGISYL